MMLGLLLQQDGATEAAVGSAFGPAHAALKADEGGGSLPKGPRIATYTALATCLSQMGQRAEALELCEAAVRPAARARPVHAAAVRASSHVDGACTARAWRAHGAWAGAAGRARRGPL